MLRQKVQTKYDVVQFVTVLPAQHLPNGQVELPYNGLSRVIHLFGLGTLIRWHLDISGHQGDGGQQHFPVAAHHAPKIERARPGSILFGNKAHKFTFISFWCMGTLNFVLWQTLSQDSLELFSLYRLLKRSPLLFALWSQICLGW